MIYYRNLLISTILSVLILLAIVGYIMYQNKNKGTYPPVLSDCPDYFSLNSDGKCQSNGVWQNLPGTTAYVPAVPAVPEVKASAVGVTPVVAYQAGIPAVAEVPYNEGCQVIDFKTNKKYELPGSGLNSGLCYKKKKAQECKITWDGLTNNYTIC